MLNEFNDIDLVLLVCKRLENINDKKIITAAEHKEKYGITEEMLQGYEEVELE